MIARPSGGYDPRSTRPPSARSTRSTGAGLDPILWPRSAGSYPGYALTGEPLRLPTGHFGLGHGGGAHAPDEYFVVKSSNPKVAGWDRAVASYVEHLYE